MNVAESADRIAAAAVQMSVEGASKRFGGVVAVAVLQEGRAPAARVVAGALALDLDDVGAEVGERLPGPGACQNAGEFEDAETGEGFRHDSFLEFSCLTPVG